MKEATIATGFFTSRKKEEAIDGAEEARDDKKYKK